VRHNAPLGALALLVVLASCSHKAPGVLNPNQRPSVTLTAAPAARDSAAPYFYAFRMNWSGYDPDGRVDHFDYCIDPTSRDSVWIRTTKNEQVVFFRATHPDPVHTGSLPTASDPHVFVIRAVDDHGALSRPVFRAFFSYTVAPTVEILDPPPSGLLGAF